MIEPFDGTLYDPCCGSGGMFIQSTDLVRAKKGDISCINVYGQEKDPATYRLAKMNLALRGISHHLGGESESTFVRDLHKGLYFNHIMANPPFILRVGMTRIPTGRTTLPRRKAMRITHGLCTFSPI